MTIYGDGSTKPLVLTGRTLNEYQNLFDQVRLFSSNVFYFCSSFFFFFMKKSKELRHKEWTRKRKNNKKRGKEIFFSLCFLFLSLFHLRYFFLFFLFFSFIYFFFQQGHAYKGSSLAASKCASKLIDIVDDLQENGTTALGPAVLFALGIAKGSPGSKVQKMNKKKEKEIEERKKGPLCVHL